MPTRRFVDPSEASNKVVVALVRQGRATIGTSSIDLPLHGDSLLFTQQGCTMRDSQDKDSPDIGNGLAIARTLHSLAQTIEDYFMSEVHQRCASKNPLRSMTDTEITGTMTLLKDEQKVRKARDERNAFARANGIMVGSQMTPEEIKTLRVTRKQTKHGILPVQNVASKVRRANGGE